MARLLGSIFFALLCGCAATPGDMKPAISSQTYTLSENYTITSVRGISSTTWVEGLTAGKYTAELENADGTFFRGPNDCVIILMNDLAQNYLKTGALPTHEYKVSKQIFHLGENGGIWIPKPGVKKPARLYYYFQPPLSKIRIVDSSNTIGTGTATGIAGAVVNTLIESGRGQIQIGPEIHDERVLRLFDLKPI